MTTADNWKVDADGDWSNPANWTNGKTPTSSNTVTISTVDVHTITHSAGADVVDQLTVGANDHFVFSGGSLEILTTASFADGYTQTGGTLEAGAISITGPGILIGGAAEGKTAFTITGTIALANYVLGGGSVLKNSSTTNQTGQITLGDSTGVNATISNAAAGVYDIAGDFGITGGAASATFMNSGTLKKGSGSGASVVGVSLTSTGTISAASGNLEFAGPTNTISGTLNGAGQISFGGGGVTTFGSVSFTAGTLGLYNTATLDLGTNLSLAGGLSDVSLDGNTTLNIATHTLTLAGAANVIEGNFGSAIVTGSGTLTNQGTLTLSTVVLGGTMTLSNTKTINQTGPVTAGDGGGGVTKISNASTGVYDFSTDSNLGENGATATLTNQGLLEKTGASGASDVSLAVTSSGTISAVKGVLEFDNTLTNTGTLSGAGTLAIVLGGVATLNSGTVLSVSSFDLLNTATLTLGVSLAYSGIFDDSSLDGATHINLAGHTLTLSGASNTMFGSFGSAVVAGSGTLANTGTLSIGNVIVDGTVVLSNTKTINQAANLEIGGGGGQVASVVNSSSGIYNLAGAFSIVDGASTASHFDNSGHFEVTAGAGVATLATTFNNLTGGVLNVTTGALQNDGVLIDAGTISGARLIAAVGSQTNLNAGASLTVKELDVENTSTVTLGANLIYAGTLIDAALDGSTVINLSTHSLTLTGASEFAASFGSDIITGAAVFKIGHASLFEGSGTVIGGTVRLEVAATVTAVGNLQIGDASANAASAVIDAGGVYDLTADTGIGRGTSAASEVFNSGLFEKTAGTGTSIVSLKFVNNGTITVTSGTVEFLAGTFSNHGTIHGVETTDSSGNVFIKPVAAASAPGAGVHRFAQTAAGFGALPTATGSAAGREPLDFHQALARPAIGHFAQIQ